MLAYLIPGNPRVRKTTVARELIRRGLTALDTDEIAGWETAEGCAAAQPDDPTGEWLSQHRWVWRRNRLEAAIQARAAAGRPVFSAGSR